MDEFQSENSNNELDQNHIENVSICFIVDIIIFKLNHNTELEFY